MSFLYAILAAFSMLEKQAWLMIFKVDQSESSDSARDLSN